KNRLRPAREKIANGPADGSIAVASLARAGLEHNLGLQVGVKRGNQNISMAPLRNPNSTKVQDLASDFVLESSQPPRRNLHCASFVPLCGRDVLDDHHVWLKDFGRPNHL